MALVRRLTIFHQDKILHLLLMLAFLQTNTKISTNLFFMASQTQEIFSSRFTGNLEWKKEAVLRINE
jgi:type IV secretory pathway VirB3-like protein